MNTKVTRSIKSLGPEEKFNILQGYILGKEQQELATAHDVPYRTIQNFISKFYKEFTQAKELNSLVKTQDSVMGYQSSFKPPKAVTEEFLDKVESTDAAHLYAFYYGKTNDNILALKEAGLYEDTKTNKYALKLKGVYLRSIPGVAKEIANIKKNTFATSDLNPEYIQSTLLQQLDQLSHNPDMDSRERTTLLKTIELLGRSVSAFSDKVTVETIDPNVALDTLIEMTSTYTIEDK